MDLRRAMASANTPFNMVFNNIFRVFLGNYAGWNIPVELTLRKRYIDDIFKTTMDKMKMEMQKN